MDSINGSITCDRGTKGVLCATCAPNFYQRAGSGECVPCDDADASDVPWTALGVLLAFAVMFKSTGERAEWIVLRSVQCHLQGCRRHLVGKSKIVLSFFQDPM